MEYDITIHYVTSQNTREHQPNKAIPVFWTFRGGACRAIRVICASGSILVC